MPFGGGASGATVVVANDLALGASASFILRAPQAATTATTQAGIATAAALTSALLVQANPATPTTPPSGSSSGGQYWAVDPTSLSLLLYLNTSGTGAPVSPLVTMPLSGAISKLLTRSVFFYTYTGAAAIIPLKVDLNFKLLLGIDSGTLALTGPWAQGALDASEVAGVRAVLRRFMYYSGSASIVPQSVDANFKLIEGIDSATNKLTGVAIGAGSTAQRTALTSGSVPVRTQRMVMLVNGESLGDGTNAVAVLSGSVPNGYSNKTFTNGPRTVGPSNAGGGGGQSDGTTGEISLIENTYIGVSNQASAGETTCSAACNYATYRRVNREGGLASSIKFCASAPAWASQPVENIRLGQARYTSFNDHVNGWSNRAVAASETYSYLAVTYHGGEINTTDNTKAYTRVAYAAQLQGLFNENRATMKTKSGQAWDPHVGTWQPAYATLNNGYQNPVVPGAIQLGQFDVINADPLTHFIGPNFFLPVGADNLHWTNIGQKWAGFYEGRFLDELLQGLVPQRLWPIAATYSGTTITLHFEVSGQGPIQLRPDILFATTDYGIKVFDNTGTLTLSNIQAGDNTVTLTVNRTLGVSPFINVGLDYAGSGQAGYGYAVHNICDSSTDTCLIGGVSYPLFNVAPQFQLSLVAADPNL